MFGHYFFSKKYFVEIPVVITDLLWVVKVRVERKECAGGALALCGPPLLMLCVAAYCSNFTGIVHNFSLALFGNSFPK